MLEPDLIAPGAFAGEKPRLQGEVFLHELDERVWSHEYFADKDSPLHVVLQGGIDRFQRPFLDLKVQGCLHLLCQRCMQPMSFDLDEDARIVLFADESKLDEAMLSDEGLEGMPMDSELSVRTLVEDQILMAMPYSPRHEHCAGENMAAVNRDKPNPFAVMAVQQNKKSPSKRGMHRSHDALTAPALSVDGATGEVHRPHHISPNGMYRGRKVMKAKGE